MCRKCTRCALNTVKRLTRCVFYRFCFRLAAGYPRAIHHHLGSAFVETLESQHEKIAASGMDLGSRTLFGTRLGFSGTPNDLLPLAMGACVPEPGSAAKTVLILTDPARPAQFRVSACAARSLNATG